MIMRRVALANVLLSDEGRSLLAHPAPAWPDRVEFTWQPRTPEKAYRAEATTHIGDGDRRAVTARILGADGPWVNDYQDYRFTFIGWALSPDAAVAFFKLPLALFIVSGDDGMPEIAITYFAVAVTSTRAPYARGVLWVDHDGSPDDWSVDAVPPRRKVTAGDRERIEGGLRLLGRLPTNMTARGKPGSGASEEQRQAIARQRLLEAGRKLQQRRMKIGRRELAGPLMIPSVDGVADVLRSAGWTLDDLTKELNSTHTS